MFLLRTCASNRYSSDNKSRHPLLKIAWDINNFDCCVGQRIYHYTWWAPQIRFRGFKQHTLFCGIIWFKISDDGPASMMRRPYLTFNIITIFCHYVDCAKSCCLRTKVNSLQPGDSNMWQKMGHIWFWYCLVACSPPNHYVTKYLLFVNLNLSSKHQWKRKPPVEYGPFCSRPYVLRNNVDWCV